jgi:hypothetical protein
MEELARRMAVRAAVRSAQFKSWSWRARLDDGIKLVGLRESSTLACGEQVHLASPGRQSPQRPAYTEEDQLGDVAEGEAAKGTWRDGRARTP